MHTVDKWYFIKNKIENDQSDVCKKDQNLEDLIKQNVDFFYLSLKTEKNNVKFGDFKYC